MLYRLLSHIHIIKIFFSFIAFLLWVKIYAKVLNNILNIKYIYNIITLFFMLV
jgi:hypothetical protein